MGDKSLEHKPFIRVNSQSGVEHVHYSVLYDGFPEEFQAVATMEFKESPACRKEGLQRLREYMKSQDMPSLKDDQYLLAALRNCKYNLKNAESKLKKLMSVRQDIVARLRNVRMETIEQILDDMPFGMLPYRDKFGRVIIYTRPTAARLDLYSLADVALVNQITVIFLLSLPITSVSGFAYFGDCTSPSLQLLYSVFKEFRSAMDVVLSLPIKLARAEVLNENSVCRWFVKAVKAIFSKKLANRVTLHGTSFEELHEMYNSAILPEEFGGTAGPLSSKVYKQKILDFIRDLLEEEC